MAPHHSRGNGHSSEPYHFFKVVLQETIQEGKLVLPTKFARDYGNALSSPVFFKVRNGEVWELELTKCDGKIWLQNGWQKFAEHYSLEFGHFLVFRYEGNCHFHVLIFDKSASEIAYPYLNNNEDIQQQEVKIKESEDDDSIQIINNISSGMRQKPELQCPRPHKMMRANSSDKTERGLKFESVATRFGHNNGFSTGKGKVQGLNFVEKCKALQRVCSGFKTENPSFLVVMQPAYVALSSSHSFSLRIPKEFSSKYLMDHGDVILCDSNGKTWSAEYHSVLGSNKRRYAYLRNGWGTFVQDNNLQVGDVCAFELIDSIDISFKVFIYPGKEAGFHRSQAFTDVSCPAKRVAGTSSSHRGCLEPLKSCETALQRAKKAREKALQRAQAFTSENPFFVVVLQRSYVLGTHALRIPSEFSRKYFKSTLTSIDVVLCLSNGKSWPAEYHQRSIGGPNGRICNGWRAFVKDNKLKVGDVCVLEMTDDTKISFTVFIFNAIADANCQPSQGVMRSNTVCRVQQVKFDEKSQALQRASAAFKSENPFFLVFIQPTYLALTSSHTYSLCIPKEFSRKYLMDHDNNIKVGDVCAFELINCIEITFKVFISRVKEADFHGSQAFTDVFCPAKREAGTSSTHRGCLEPLMACETALQRAKKAREKALQKAQTFTSENPFFIVVLQQSYVLGTHALYIPDVFSRKHFKRTLTSVDVVLCLSNGKSWPAQYHQKSSGRPNGRICAGWKAFVKDNELKVGDVCVLEMTDDIKISFKVYIFKAIAEANCQPFAEANSQPSQGV
ncbi:hypothetical protein REPUB_Repub10bG0152200 [Reevesia pubescens]